MTGALIALALLAYVALHEWVEAYDDLDTRLRVGLALIVITAGLIGALCEAWFQALWGWLL